MGNKISKTCGDTYRSCRNVTCLDDCKCLRCFKRKSGGPFVPSSQATLETISMPYIDETGKLLIIQFHARLSK